MIKYGSRAIVFLLCYGLLLTTACYSDQPVEALADRFRTGYQDAFTEAANPLLVSASLPARLDSIGKFQNLLIAVDTHYLSRSGKDKRLELESRLREERAQWEPYRTDPSLYNLGGLLKKSLVNTVGRPADERIKELQAIMEHADTYYRNARQNLIVKDVSLYRLAAQKQYLGLEFLHKELRDSLAGFPFSPSEKDALDRNIRQTELALKDYMGFCESVFLNYRDSTYYQDAKGDRQKAGALQ